MMIETIPPDAKTFACTYEKEVRLKVIIHSDTNFEFVMADGYEVIEGFLLLTRGDRVVATFNCDQWIGIRE